jgi:hypothetical protein
MYVYVYEYVICVLKFWKKIKKLEFLEKIKDNKNIFFQKDQI